MYLQTTTIEDYINHLEKKTSFAALRCQSRPIRVGPTATAQYIWTGVFTAAQGHTIVTLGIQIHECYEPELQANNQIQGKVEQRWAELKAEMEARGIELQEGCLTHEPPSYLT